MVVRPTLSATWAQIVLIEYVSAVVSDWGPHDWLPSFDSGTPETLIGELPFTVESGAYLPLSIAAVSVTTLKVEPGGYEACVARLKVDTPGASTLLSLYEGLAYITLTAPVFGLRATTDPA